MESAVWSAILRASNERWIQLSIRVKIHFSYTYMVLQGFFTDQAQRYSFRKFPRPLSIYVRFPLLEYFPNCSMFNVVQCCLPSCVLRFQQWRLHIIFSFISATSQGWCCRGLDHTGLRELLLCLFNRILLGSYHWSWDFIITWVNILVWHHRMS